MGGEETKALIQKLSESLKTYDIALESGYRQSLALANAGKKPWTEEQVKVLARQKVRDSGLEVPEVYRWWLRASLGGIIEET